MLTGFAAPTSRHLHSVTLFPHDRPLRLRSGTALTDVQVAYETYGPSENAAHGTVFVCHALTGDAHVARHDEHDMPGWWEAVVGPGKPIDTTRYHVLCANVLGGCAGTTGPWSPARDGRPYGARFPRIEVSDIVTVHRELLRHLGIGRLHAVVGGSLGGMQALEWLLRFPDSARMFVLIATSARMSADNLAFNAVGRAAIRADPRFAEGNYPADERPGDGLGIARMVGHLTYLSPESLERKFGRSRSVAAPANLAAVATGPFTVERYLENQAAKLNERFDANTYLYVSAAMDGFDAFAEPPSFGSAKPAVHLFSFAGDRLFGSEHSRQIRDRLADLGIDATHHHETTSRVGHDAFLLPTSGYLAELAARMRAVEPKPPEAAQRQGGDLRGLSGNDHLDLSTCVNRYGPPPSVGAVVRAFRPELLRAHPYDAEDRFATVYSKYLGVPADQLVVGRGITEFIRALAALLPAEQVSVIAPDYTDTIRWFPRHDNPPDNAPEHAAARLVRVDRAMSENRYVIMSNPNNPTGTYLHRDDLVGLCRRHADSMLIVDEAYIDFVAGSDDLSMVHSGQPNVIVLRSPNKPFGIAGVRTGALWTPDDDIRKKVRHHRLNWPLSYLDVLAAEAALETPSWLTETRDRLLADSVVLQDALAELGAVDSHVPVHYRFLRHDDPLGLHRQLLAHGIVTRVFTGNEPGRMPGLRLSTPTGEELPLVLAALAKSRG
ncbi:MAG TPA: homoserine O-acetyltransferase [Amycolatopsis sp.]|uniref:homoserine O-acetyltransferase MetX n=1 Tax=Amycolatopsis sp. TaxID=37632 RepID=UPI002B483FD1|nr:homoserine O-acetyltransferase [Amycolatopsis sp.]HKS45056.1 homoserine O-acetyltransferase [Amycolatopsis sp.]